ncbi:type II toxin-antitoxin system RelE/ParE family toxin [Xenorhabdus bovienii]|uniref:type II toxin-antitoxin system RelE/ParE family toxin n=1 Tax=Xenorhabdus bovienii TaxID=40576 RepID=UPI0023B2B86C|nr:type II toxin-antitoxin system RelE/ParE family toxin [Xenorhabdus bovienii]MDE9428846.1 type II toxin-antitoxin system RelE/ParE family toxin [Xenorhabdus bovienii]
MRDFVRQQQEKTAYDAWFREQVQIGIDDANTGNLIPAIDELLSEKVSRMIDHPNSGRLGKISGTRELVAHRNYVLVYDVIGEIVRTLRMLHTSRQWP